MIKDVATNDVGAFKSEESRCGKSFCNFGMHYEIIRISKLYFEISYLNIQHNLHSIS